MRRAWRTLGDCPAHLPRYYRRTVIWRLGMAVIELSMSSQASIIQRSSRRSDVDEQDRIINTISFDAPAGPGQLLDALQRTGIDCVIACRCK